MPESHSMAKAILHQSTSPERSTRSLKTRSVSFVHSSPRGFLLPPPGYPGMIPSFGSFDSFLSVVRAPRCRFGCGLAHRKPCLCFCMPIVFGKVRKIRKRAASSIGGGVERVLTRYRSKYTTLKNQRWVARPRKIKRPMKRDGEKLATSGVATAAHLSLVERVCCAMSIANRPTTAVPLECEVKAE